MWVPGQDLAMAHLMRTAIAKSVFCHYTVCYSTSVRAQAQMRSLYKGSSRPVLVHDMNMHDSKQSGQCPGMPGPAGAYVFG